MRRLFAFLATTIDGYHEGPKRELDWHNASEAEGSGFPIASGFPHLGDPARDEIDTIVFGRVTYELMASYWPTREAEEADPEIAARMNGLQKVVVSRTLEGADWANTRLVRNAVAELTELKQAPGKDLGIFGSSTLTASLLPTGLIDELRILVNPVVLGAGHPVLASAARASMTLAGCRTFPSGNVLLTYHPAADRGER
ncbi:MAG TPA: dihydrofolate reductase family protein [Actinomycetota bacterium]